MYGHNRNEFCIELKLTRIGTPRTSWKPASRWLFKVHHTTCGRHQEVPAGWQGGAVEHDSFTYVHGTPAVRNACQKDSLAGGVLRGGPADSWNHASMNPPKEYLLHLQPPRRGAFTPTMRESSAYDAEQPFVSFFRNSANDLYSV